MRPVANTQPKDAGAPRGGPKVSTAAVDANDAPVLDLNGAAPGLSTTVAYGPGNPLTMIAPAGTVVDADSPDFHGGSLRVGFTGTGTATDQLVIMTDTTLTLTGNDHSAQRQIKINGTLIGTASGGRNGTDLVISLHSSATAAQVQTLLEHIGYANSSSTQPTSPRTVTFTLIDGDGTANGGDDTGTATATITFGSSNNAAPAVTGDCAANVAEGGSYVITSADLCFSDPDDGAAGVTFTISNLVNGTLKVGGNAATSFTGQQLAGGLVTFLHDGSETAAASFSVVVEDGNEDGSAPVASTFHFTVSAVNDPPFVACDLVADVAEGGLYTLTEADLWFSDPDDGASEVTFTVSNQVNGSMTVNGVAAVSFTAQQLSDGLVAFRHDGSETGTASFVVFVEDGNEDGSAPMPSVFNFTVSAVNDAPVLAGDRSATVAEGGTYVITAADLGFSDPDDSASGVTFTISSPVNGSLKVNGSAATSFSGQQLLDGLVTFQHDGSETIAAAFGVVVEDGNEDGSSPLSSTFNFTVSPVNDAPVLTGDRSADVAEGGTYVVTAADLGFSDPDDGASGVTFTISNLVNGIVRVNGVAAATFTGQQLLDGLVTFQHDGSETTTAAFGVVVEDGNEDGSAPLSSTFNFAVSAVNDAPVLTGDHSAAVLEGGLYVITAADLGFGDPDDSASGVTFTISNPVNGTLRVNGSAATSFSGQQLLDGLVTFEHDGSETTTAAFGVAVEDGNEDGSAPLSSTFSFAVTPVNDAPVLSGDLSADVAEGGLYVVTAADLGFSDPDDGASGVTFTVSNPINGSVKVNGVAATSFSGQQLLDGVVAFAHDGSETAAASFAVRVEDGNEDGSAPVESTFTFAVSAVNDAPVLTGDLSADVVKNGSHRIVAADLGFSDPDDLAADVTFTVSNQVNGTVKVNGVAATSFTGQQLLDGVVKFTHDGSNTVAASFDVLVEDGDEDGSAPVASTFSLTVKPADIDLTMLTASQGFVIQGDAAGDNAGFSVSAAGDVNGDGIDDLIVGAPLGNDGGSDAGEAYIVFGKDSGFGTVDLSTLSIASGLIIRGDTAGDHAGWSVSAAGDVNGDGIADVVVGAPLNDHGGGNAGEAYVVFGKESGFGTLVVDLTALPASAGFIIRGDADDDWAGYKVSSAGDVNGDGFDDLIVGAPNGDDGATSAGEAYVVFGKASGFATIDLGTLAASDGFVIQGDAQLDKAGWSVSAAGDVNGDGFDDMIVGAIFGDNGGTDAGEAYVVFGKGTGFGVPTGGRQVLDLSVLTPSDGFIIQGDSGLDQAGASVSAAGDVNGDGFGDLIVGAIEGDEGGANAGEAYVVFGKASGFGTIDLTTLTAAQGFLIIGDAGNDQAGFSVSAAGDVNGDGFDDVLVGAPFGDNGGVDAGEAYLVFGKESGFGTASGGRQVIDLATLSFPDGFIIQGDAAGDQFGRSVAAAGDVNNDGFDDLIVGAPMGDDGGSNAGEAYVIFGSAFWIV